MKKQNTHTIFQGKNAQVSVVTLNLLTTTGLSIYISYWFEIGYIHIVDHAS